MAATSIRRRFGRSVLTVAAVALAATLLVALVTIAGTARTKVLSELSKGGPLSGITVAAAEADPSQVDNDSPRPGSLNLQHAATYERQPRRPDGDRSEVRDDCVAGRCSLEAQEVGAVERERIGLRSVMSDAIVIVEDVMASILLLRAVQS